MGQDICRRNNVRILGNDGPTIVFAHGFGTDQRAWRHQVEAFAATHRVVLFDHIGSGKSDLAAYSPRRYGSYHGYAEDFLELCAALDVEQCTVVAHSMSCIISLLAALVEPKRFRRFVFLSASPHYLNEDGYHGGFEQTDLDALYAAMSSNYYAWASGFAPMAMSNPERPELATEFAATLSEIRPDIALAVLRMAFQSDHRDDLPRLNVPTLIIQASEDIAVPVEVGQYMKAKVPKSTLVSINARGHLPHMSAPGEVTRAIQAFVA